jgi:cobalt-zinc-cadmium efflux system outer membrane protein
MKTLQRLALSAQFAAAALAQTPLSLDQALAEALSKHPAIAAAAARIDSARGLARQAGLAPNPKLILQHENARPYGGTSQIFWRDTDSFAYLQQTFETAGRRTRRVAAARAGIARAEAYRELERQQIAARVRSAYWSAAGATAVLELLGESRTNFQRIIEYHEARVKEGAMAEVDLLRVKLEGDRLDVALNTARLASEKSMIQLLREMGRVEFDPVALSDRIQAERPAVSADAAKAVSDRAEVRVARAEVETVRLTAGIQQAAATPNVDALLGYKRTLGFSSIIGGVQFDLPFRNRNEGNIEAALSETRAAEANAAATEAVVRAEVASAQREVEIRARQIRSTLEPMLAQARRASDIARAAYREGGADLLRLLDAERIRLETEQVHLQTLAEYRQSLAALESAMGVLP